MFTVVIPTYGRAERLKKAIQSVLIQTLEVREIIVIDDNLDDELSKNTKKIVESFSNPRIKYIKNIKNMGANYCRNLGMEKAEGKYIAFLDDDDEFYKEKLEIIFKNLNNEVDLIYSSVELYNESCDKSNIMFRKEKKIKEKILSYNFIGGSSSVVLRKKIYDEIGGFDESLPSCQDWDFWAKVIFNGAKVKALENILVKVIVHDSPERITNNLSKRVIGHQMLFKKLRKYYNSSMNIKKIEDNQSLVIANLYYDMNDFKNYIKIINKVRIQNYRKQDFLRKFLLKIKLKVDRFGWKKIKREI